MVTKRRFIRISCKVKCSLEHHGRLYHCHLENVSPNGALLRLHEAMLARPGDECRLSVYSDEKKAPFRLRAEMVHVGFSMAGVRFMAMAEADNKTLVSLLEKLSSNTPVHLQSEIKPV